MITMPLEEQLILIKEQVRQALVTSLEEKQDGKARKLFSIMNDVSGLIPYSFKVSTPSTSSAPDIITFDGADAGLVSDRL